MESDERLLVPVGPDAARWRTFGGDRTLVVAARTVTSLVRVLDVVPEVVRDDPRITVVFAYDPTSAFNNGVLDLLRSLGCRTLPWPQLSEIAPDLLISASENIQLPPGDCPVLVLPHGVGFQKLVPDSAGPGTRLSGLVSPSCWRPGGPGSPYRIPIRPRSWPPPIPVRPAVRSSSATPATTGSGRAPAGGTGTGPRSAYSPASGWSW